MPWLAAQLTCTDPAAGCAKSKTYGPASEPATFVAGTPLTSKSAASTPATGSLNVTDRLVNDGSVAPGCGLTAVTVGGMVSR